MAAGLLRQFSGLFNDLGKLIGYRNPVSQQDELGFPQQLVQSAIPFILQSSGSIGNNGALSGLTALQTTYSGGAFMYFPANAIAAGVPAGWYWTVMSSTTAGTIYNNQYQGGDPKNSVPLVLVPFTTTGPGAYTQVTTAVTAHQIIVPGGALGPNGVLEGSASWLNNASAGTKTFFVAFDGASLPVWQQTASTPTTRYDGRFSFANVNSQSAQALVSSSFSGGFGGVALNDTLSSVNTSTDRVVTTSLQLATATDFAACRHLKLELRYGA